MTPKLSIPHRFRFGRPVDLRQREGWDELRLAGESAFAFSKDRATWLERSSAPAVVARAQALDLLVGDARSVASYGAGTGVIERALFALDPARRLVLTEFAPRTVARLAELFPEATVVEHDLRYDGPVAGVGLHLFFRLDTELDDASFRDVLGRFRRERVVVVATELLSVRAVVREAATWLRRGSVPAGRVRNREAFEALFEPTHLRRAVRVDDLDGWLLEPRAATD